MPRPVTQFSSDRYRRFTTGQKAVFWFGVLLFLHPGYWILRLILYLTLQDEPARRRLDAYAVQTFVFGAIFGVLLLLLFGLTIIASVAGLR